MTDFIVSFNRKFETAHRFINSCKGSCQSIHGHSWNLTFSFKFHANEAFEECMSSKEGFICEYIHLKKQFSDFLEDIMDHSICLNVNDPIIETLNKNDSDRIVLFHNDPTTEMIAICLLKKLWVIVDELKKHHSGIGKIRGLEIYLKETLVNSVSVSGFPDPLYGFPKWATTYENIRDFK